MSLDTNLFEVLDQQFNIEIPEKASLSKLGEGAWHEVYKIERTHKEDLVLRIKKRMAYGVHQDFNPIDLKAEYEASKAYYRQANQCIFKICPAFFEYFLSENLVFTLESFMDKSVSYQSLSSTTSFLCGKKLGEFFYLMHQKTPDIKGPG